jgi:putative peptidoglycan lipid II flippase
VLKKQSFKSLPLRKLGGEAALAGGTSLFGKCVGFVKELFVAAAFGLSGEIDVYLVAMVVIGFPMSILLNATQSAMIATLAADTHYESSEHSAIFVRVVLLILGTLCILLAAWMALMPLLVPVFASGFSNTRMDQLSSAIVWLVPYYFFGGLNFLGYGYLQTRRQYVANGFVPIMTPIVVLLVVGFGHQHAAALPLLTGSIVIGAFLETGVLVMLLKSLDIKIRGGIRLNVKAKAKVARIVRGSLQLLPGTAIMALSPLVDQSLAATLAEGSNAALAYGNKLPAAIQGVLTTAIAITVLPFFSAQLAERGPQYCLSILKRLAVLISVGGLVVATPLVLMSGPLVDLLYVRGMFTIEDAAVVTPIQSIYLLHIPVTMMLMLCMKVTVAQGRHVLISTLSIASVSIHLFVGTVLKQEYGAMGIAIAATIANALTAGAYFACAVYGLRRHANSIGSTGT